MTLQLIPAANPQGRLSESCIQLHRRLRVDLHESAEPFSHVRDIQTFLPNGHSTTVTT
jgi:hypothetical protein